LPLIYASAVWLSIGWLALAFVQQPWMAFGISIIFFCIMGTLSAQIFAALRDAMSQVGETNESMINSTVRAAYSLGWIVGPVFSGWLAASVGVRGAFLVTGAFYLLSIFPMRNLDCRRTSEEPEKKTSTSRLWTQANVRMLSFTLITILILSGDAIKLSYLPLYVVGPLKQPTVVFGSLLSFSAIIELGALPLVGALSDRYGPHRVISWSAALGVLDYTILATSSQVWQVFLSQLLHVGVIAVMYGVGVTYAQSLGRHQPGLASSAFFSAQTIASPLGSILGSYGVHYLGLSRVFFIPSFMCLFALAILIFMRGAPIVDNLDQQGHVS